MSRSEAGKLGAEANKITQAKLKKERMDSYYADPLLCLECNAPIQYEKKSASIFCNKHCSAVYNNRKRISKYAGRICGFCSAPLPTDKAHSYSKYCNQECSGAMFRKRTMDKLVELGYDVNRAGAKAKLYIIATKGHQCEICHLTEWMGQPIPLTLDHINGDPTNNYLTNLRVICPNCDR